MPELNPVTLLAFELAAALLLLNAFLLVHSRRRRVALEDLQARSMALSAELGATRTRIEVLREQLETSRQDGDRAAGELEKLQKVVQSQRKLIASLKEKTDAAKGEDVAALQGELERQRELTREAENRIGDLRSRLGGQQSENGVGTEPETPSAATEQLSEKDRLTTIAMLEVQTGTLTAQLGELTEENERQQLNEQLAEIRQELRELQALAPR